MSPGFAHASFDPSHYQPSVLAPAGSILSTLVIQQRENGWAFPRNSILPKIPLPLLPREQAEAWVIYTAEGKRGEALPGS